jgi:hypothetical protein
MIEGVGIGQHKYKKKTIPFAGNYSFNGTVLSKKLYKTLPVLDHLRKQFAFMFTPDQNICIDKIPCSLEKVPELETVHSLQKE